MLVFSGFIVAGSAVREIEGNNVSASVFDMTSGESVLGWELIEVGKLQPDKTEIRIMMIVDMINCLFIFLPKTNFQAPEFFSRISHLTIKNFDLPRRKISCEAYSLVQEHGFT